MLQHAVNDAVRPTAMLPHLAQIDLEVGQNFGDFLRKVGVVLLGLADDLADLVNQLNRKLGKVAHEVQRVLDFVGDAGGQLAQGRQLLLRDHLLLSLVQPLQGLLQSLVLVLQLLG